MQGLGVGRTEKGRMRKGGIGISEKIKYIGHSKWIIAMITSTMIIISLS